MPIKKEWLDTYVYDFVVIFPRPATDLERRVEAVRGHRAPRGAHPVLHRHGDDFGVNQAETHGKLMGYSVVWQD